MLITVERYRDFPTKPGVVQELRLGEVVTSPLDIPIVAIAILLLLLVLLLVSGGADGRFLPSAKGEQSSSKPEHRSGRGQPVGCLVVKSFGSSIRIAKR